MRVLQSNKPVAYSFYGRRLIDRIYPQTRTVRQLSQDNIFFEVSAANRDPTSAFLFAGAIVLPREVKWVPFIIEGRF